ncbi:hypothetical protein L6R52_40215 [Myxococcota bacterium]|nr:hypothetical protein [Myxococcota bacterium]
MARPLASLATLALVTCAVSLTRCAALDEFEHVMSDEATIPGTVGAGALFELGYGGDFDSVDLSSEQSFQNQGVSPSDVDAIFVKAIHIEGANPNIDRLDVIIESMEVYVEAPGLERKTIGTLTNIPMGAAADLVVDSTLNLKPYAVAPSMKVGAVVDIKQRPAFDTTIRTTVTLLVDINLLGS